MSLTNYFLNFWPLKFCWPPNPQNWRDISRIKMTLASLRQKVFHRCNNPSWQVKTTVTVSQMLLDKLRISPRSLSLSLSQHARHITQLKFLFICYGIKTNKKWTPRLLQCKLLWHKSSCLNSKKPCHLANCIFQCCVTLLNWYLIVVFFLIELQFTVTVHS